MESSIFHKISKVIVRTLDSVKWWAEYDVKTLATVAIYSFCVRLQLVCLLSISSVVLGSYTLIAAHIWLNKAEKLMSIRGMWPKQ